MAIYSVLVLSGQSAATLLGRLYYEKGGNSEYVAALMQCAGFPILIPLLFIKTGENKNLTTEQIQETNSFALPILYICFGMFLAFDCMLYAVGLMYLPVSTYSLVCASQLGFNAFFSYFINSQKLTPLIVNSIYILTISTIILALLPDSSSGQASGQGKHTLGFVCTLTGSAGYALLLSVQQLAYGKVLGRQTIKEILNVIFYESMVTTCALSIGLFGSGGWRGLRGEMEGFELGEKWYVVIVICAALGWQVFGVGMVALILNVSALFGNVVSTMNVGVVPVLAVVAFKDRMSGLKVVAMVLAIWGSVSYVYQQYLDHVKCRGEDDAQYSSSRELDVPS